MSNTITDCLTGEQINFLKEHFFSFWSDNGTTDQKAIADMVAVSSLEDLNRLFDVIKLLSHCEMPANEISNFINSNIKFSIPLDESLLWLNRVVRILKVEYESKEILINVENSLVNRMRDKVAWLLNRYPETRDSDIALQLRYWEEFEGEIYSVGFISTNDLYKLSRLTTIARERARIQNQYRLFLGTERVRRRRKESEEQVKNLSKEDKPKHPVIVTFLDETGKTQKYLIIGGYGSSQGSRTVIYSMR